MSTEPDAIEPGAIVEPDVIMASIDYSKCPAHVRPGMRRWIEDGVIPGGFLAAVLRNDLAGAIARASDISFPGLLHLLHFLHFQAPGGAHGSCANVEEWAVKGGLKGILRGGPGGRVEGESNERKVNTEKS